MTFPCIRERVREKRLRLQSWPIDIRSCELQIFDPVRQNFEAVN
jgi:hypothetical protein